MEPTVQLDLSEDDDDEHAAKAREFARERRAQRYNKQSNAVLDAWVRALFGEEKTSVEIGVNGGTGIGARFEVLPITGFSGLG